MLKNILHERPLFSLLDFLHFHRVSSLTRKANIKRSKLIGNPLQEIVLNMLLHDGCIVKEVVDGLKTIYEYQYGSYSVKYLYGKGESKAQAFFTRNKTKECIINLKDLLNNIANTPLIIIDMKYWDLLLKEEQNKLINQLIFTLYNVRKYLWDLNLVITNINSEDLKRKIEETFGLNKVIKKYFDTEQYLEKNSIEYNDAILLDPNANRVLEPVEVLKAKAFIVGGIVDRIIPRKGITSSLVENPNIKKRKIVLRNSIVGVPFSVNKIVEIILRSRYETSGNIGLAIRKSFSKRDIRWRVRHECLKLGRVYEWDLKKIYNRIRIWLPINFEDFKKICMRYRQQV